MHFTPQRYLLAGGCECVGWADEKGLKIATSNTISEWVSVLIHETCHFDQHNERPQWVSKIDGAINKFDSYLAGKKITIKEAKKAAKDCIRIEHDCEARTLRKIRRNKLPFDLVEYAKKANAYILGYHVSVTNRRWCKESYTNETIWKNMPPKLLPLKLALNPPKKLLDLYNTTSPSSSAMKKKKK